MANKIVRLVKRIKITDALTQGHLSKFSSVITPEEFQAFQSDVAKNLWLIFYTIVSEVIDYQHVAVLKMA